MLQTVAMDTIHTLSFPCCPFVNSSVYLGQTTLPHNSCLSHSRSLPRVCHIWHWFKMLNRLSQTAPKKTSSPHIPNRSTGLLQAAGGRQRDKSIALRWAASIRSTGVKWVNGCDSEWYDTSRYLQMHYDTSRYLQMHHFQVG